MKNPIAKTVREVKLEDTLREMARLIQEQPRGYWGLLEVLAKLVMGELDDH